MGETSVINSDNVCIPDYFPRSGSESQKVYYICSKAEYHTLLRKAMSTISIYYNITTD